MPRATWPTDVTMTQAETGRQDIIPCVRAAQPLPVTCSVCNRVGHDGPTCTLAPAAYEKVGIEIEGYWVDLRTWMARASGTLMDRGNADGIQHEFRTKAAPPTGCLEQLYDFYPDGTHSFCGMHVHVSFPHAAEVSLLACPDFIQKWKESWKQWGKDRGLPADHHFWHRLRGSNRFCSPNGLASIEDPMRGSRYLQLNFTSWGKGYKTLECRMLPMFVDRADAIAAVVHLLSLYDEHLSTVAFEHTHGGKAPGALKAPEVLKEAQAQMVTDPLFTRIPKKELAAPGLVRVDYKSEVRAMPPASPGNKYINARELYDTMYNNLNYGRKLI